MEEYKKAMKLLSEEFKQRNSQIQSDMVELSRQYQEIE